MRSLLSLGAVIAVTLTCAVPLHAQTVDEIVARNIDAKGGEALLRSTTSVRTTGRGTMQGQSVRVVTMSKRPFMMRNEMTMTQRMVQAFDGDNLWMAIGDNPPQVLPAGEQVEALKRTSQIDSPLLDYRSKGTDIRLGESSAEGGRQLHHLIVTPKGAPPMHYYIDAATNLESRMTIEMEQDGQKMRMEMRFSDFRTVDGRTVPFTVSQFMNGTQMGQMNFDKIEFNIPLSDDLFRLPRK